MTIVTVFGMIGTVTKRNRLTIKALAKSSVSIVTVFGMIEADIQEISDDFVSYKAFNNPDGPNYKMSTSKIVKIKFRNGTEQTFDKQATSSITITGVNAPVGQLTYKSGDLYCNGAKLTETDMKNMLPINLYQQANSGLNMRKHGKRLVIAGSILSAVGIAGTAIGGSNLTYYENGTLYYDEGAAVIYVLGATVMSVGLTCLAVGVPLYCVGQHRAKKAASTYNTSNGYPELTFNVGTTGNGFGLFMTF